MNRLKLIVTIAIVLLAVIIIFLNIKSVETNFLFFTISMPLIILLLFTMGVGFLLGIMYKTRKDKNQK